MSNLIKSLQQSLNATTLSDMIRVRTSEEVYLLLDVSGSMDSKMANGKSREVGLQETVKEITKERPVKMIAFGGRDGGAYLVTAIPSSGGGTPLHLAIDLAKQKECGRCVVISDGCPDSVSAAMEAAKKFGGRIDVVFVGNPGEYGEEFLKQLAESTGGTEFHGDLGVPKELGGKIMGLLGEASDDEEPKGAIQL